MKEVFSLSIIFYVVAAVLFALAGLTPVFHWNLGSFDVIAWGLCALALGHCVGGSLFGVRRGRVL